jgi:DNA-3-methyladenine glycosylase II
VVIRQDDDGVHGWVQGEGDLAAVQAQVARVLSLDHDGRPLDEIARRDPVMGRLVAAAPGLRPPLFYSPFEAAAWAVLSARRPAAQMAELRRRLNEAYGYCFELEGRQLAAHPSPEQLLAIPSFPGLPELKLQRLKTIAEAALAGRLDADRLQSLPIDEARAELQSLPGIGPFYAELILVRATGLADLLPTSEPRLAKLAGPLYGLEGPATPADLDRLGQAWRPLRTWCAVLVRAASRRLPAAG